MVHCVIFRGPFPHALRLHRAGFPGGIGLILNCVDLNVGKLLIVFERLWIVAPQAGLSLEVQAGKQRAHTLQIRFFNEYVRRQPQARLQIQAPAVEVQDNSCSVNEENRFR